MRAGNHPRRLKINEDAAEITRWNESKLKIAGGGGGIVPHLDGNAEKSAARERTFV